MPDLFWLEIGNILWKAIRSARISEHVAHQAIDWIGRLAIPTFPSRSLLGDAVTIALSLNRTVYEAVYLSLAAASGRPLVTADECLVSAVGARLPVRRLGSMV